MNEIDFLEAVGKTDIKYIEECVTYEKPEKSFSILKKASLIAACLALAAVGIFIYNRYGKAESVDNNPGNKTVITDADGFHVENGVLLSYSGAENEVVIPENVESVADYAFMENPHRKEIRVVRLGKNVGKVEYNAFAGLEKLETLSIDEENGAFVNDNGFILSPDGTVLYRVEQENTDTLTLPDTVRVIASCAVCNKGLKEVCFGSSVEILAYNCFGGNGELKAINLPDTVKLIGSCAFSGCISAVDGRIPDGATVEEYAFYGVPFYNSLLAGETCPGEEISRGLVTPSEAVLKSDLDTLSREINVILLCLKNRAGQTEEGLIDQSQFTDEEIFACNASTLIKEIPENAVIPETFTFDELGFSDSGWGNTGIYDLRITLPCGDQLLVMEAYGYALYYELYWKDAVFRIQNAYFVPAASPQEDENSFGWSAEMYTDDRLYTGLTLINSDGRIINCAYIQSSETPYKLTYSPDGTRVAIEYTKGLNTSVYVQSLNGDKLHNGTYDYAVYMNTYYGRYQKGTLGWKDNETIEGINEYGRFEWNIHEYGIKITEEKDPDEEPDMVYKALELLKTKALSLRIKYGDFSYEYADGDFSVFSVKDVPGLLFGFALVEEPFLPDDRMYPSEVIIDGNYSDAVYGLRVGERIEDKDGYYWDSVIPDLSSGIVTLEKNFGEYSIFVSVSRGPDDSKTFLTGEIAKISFQIRIN